MATPDNYEYTELRLMGPEAEAEAEAEAEGPASEDPSSPPDLTIICYRSKVRIARLVWYPLLLVVLYLLLSLWPKAPSRIIGSNDYASYLGKSALATSLALPRLQSYNEGPDYERREKVKGLIKETWALYVQQAWGWDEVRPVSGGGRDTRYFELEKFELTAQKWVGCNNCGWFKYTTHRWSRRGVRCRVELYAFYRFHCLGRPCESI
jgi:hypothetical protein